MNALSQAVAHPVRSVGMIVGWFVVYSALFWLVLAEAAMALPETLALLLFIGAAVILPALLALYLAGATIIGLLRGRASWGSALLVSLITIAVVLYAALAAFFVLFTVVGFS